MSQYFLLLFIHFIYNIVKILELNVVTKMMYTYIQVLGSCSVPPLQKKKKRLQNKKQKRQIYKGLWVYYFDAVQVTFVKIYKVFIAWGGRYTIYVRVDAQGY